MANTIRRHINQDSNSPTSFDSNLPGVNSLTSVLYQHFYDYVFMVPTSLASIRSYFYHSTREARLCGHTYTEKRDRNNGNFSERTMRAWHALDPPRNLFRFDRFSAHSVTTRYLVPHSPSPPFQHRRCHGESPTERDRL